MIELLEERLIQPAIHSSKGNQLKWKQDGIWYKADYTGYEGLAEYVISELLKLSTLKPQEFVKYEIAEVRYHNRDLIGAKSRDLLEGDWQIITLERLFRNQYNTSLYTALWSMQGVKERIRFLCEQVERITGLEKFGVHMAKLLTIDALFLNEDRHTHNIAVLMNAAGEYRVCPIFDNGACLLADTRQDYPLKGDVYTQIDEVKAKTVSSSFDEQLDAVEELFGEQIHFRFAKKDVERIVDGAPAYTTCEKERVKTILYQQMRRYKYLFQ